MNPDGSTGRWPLLVWSLQLAPAGSLSWICTRLVLADRDVGVPMPMLLAGAGALAWLSLSAAMLAAPRGRRWIVERRTQWHVVMGMFALSLALGDLVMTWSGLVPTLEDQRARSLDYTYYRYSGYRMVPKSISVDRGAPIHINARGFRGPEIEPETPAGRARIVFLGGSQVFDFHGGDWPALTGALLRRRGYGVEVVNAGVPGHNSTDSLFKLATDIWTLRPDAVFVCHGWNDVKYFPRLVAGVPYRGLPPAAPVTMHRDWRLYPTGIDRLFGHSAVYRYFRLGLVNLYVTAEGRDLWQFDVDRDGKATFDDFGPRQFELNMRLIARLITAIDAVGMFCKQPMLESGTSSAGIDAASYASRNVGLAPDERVRAFAAIRRIIDAVAADTGVSVVDLQAALSGRPEYFHDGIHFSPAGSRAAARLTADAIEAIVLQPAIDK